MTGVCRVGDTVIGRCEASASGHPRDFTGVWVTGAGNVDSNGISVVREGDTGITDCGHIFVAAHGSDNVTSNGLSVQRVGDPVIVQEGGTGISVTGAPNVTAN
jgi:uncharacterized Zn-binding protein involved in type VI secretion